MNSKKNGRKVIFAGDFNFIPNQRFAKYISEIELKNLEGARKKFAISDNKCLDQLSHIAKEIGINYQEGKTTLKNFKTNLYSRLD